MESNAQIAKPEEPEHIYNLDDIVQKLGDLAPPAPDKTLDGDHTKQHEYLRKVISTAKQNSNLFTLEEMGRVWAAYFLLQATATEEGKKALGLEARPTTAPETLAKMDPKLAAALKVATAIVQNSNNPIPRYRKHAEYPNWRLVQRQTERQCGSN